MREEKLIAELKKADAGALEKIMRKYSGYVFTVARNFSRGGLSSEDIDEISVEVFYKLWKIREKLDIKTGLSGYLSSMTRNAVKDRFKAMPPHSADISELELASELFVEDAAELSDMMNTLNGGVALLSPAEQELFTRFYLYGEKTSQIAQKTGKSESAIHTGLYRIREKLKKYMTERGYDHV